MLLGGFFQLFAVFILPLLAVLGYYIRVLRYVAADVDHIPVFDDWRSLLYDGVMHLGITASYLIVPVLIVGVISFGLQFIHPMAATIWQVIGSALLFLLIYFLPAALTNYAREDRFGAAFDLRTLHTVAGKKTYLKPFLLSLVILAALIAVSAVGSMFVQLLLSFASFYLGVVVMFLMAQGFTTSLSD